MPSSIHTEDDLALDSFEKSIQQVTQFVLEQSSLSAEKKDDSVSELINDLSTLENAVKTSSNSPSNDERKQINAFIIKFNIAVERTINKDNEYTIDQQSEAVREALEAANVIQNMAGAVTDALEAAEAIQNTATETILHIACRVIGGLIGLILGVPLGIIGGVAAMAITLCTDHNGMFIARDPFALKLFFITAVVGGALLGGGYGAFLGWTKLSQYLYDLVSPSNEDLRSSATPAQAEEHPVKKTATSVLTSSFFSKPPKPSAPLEWVDPAWLNNTPPGGPPVVGAL